MNIGPLRRELHEAAKQYARCPFGMKARARERLIKARTATLVAEIERNEQRAARRNKAARRLG